MTIGTVDGDVTLNPVVLGAISGAGIMLGTFSERKNYKRKIEMCRFAFITYLKILANLLDQMKLLDEMIIDLCLVPINKYMYINTTNNSNKHSFDFVTE